MPTRSREIPATLEELFAVLTDYEKYVDWSPDVVGAAVLVREGDIVVADFQSPVLLEGKSILELVHSRPTSITYRQVDQHESRCLQGTWMLAAATCSAGPVVTGQMEFRTDLLKATAAGRRADRVLHRRIDALQAHAALFRRGNAEPGLADPSSFASLADGRRRRLGISRWNTASRGPTGDSAVFQGRRTAGRFGGTCWRSIHGRSGGSV